MKSPKSTSATCLLRLKFIRLEEKRASNVGEQWQLTENLSCQTHYTYDEAETEKN